MSEPSDQDYQRLLELRTGLRRFLHWSEEQARRQGITSVQHQLLLAIRGHPDPLGPTVGEIADYLVIRPHSAVGLIDRAAAHGLVVRVADPCRAGTVRVVLSDPGRRALESLSTLHLAELARLVPSMQTLWRAPQRPASRERDSGRDPSPPGDLGPGDLGPGDLAPGPRAAG
jgi:DNA-binding MarR family transcriptional regulator